MLAWEAARNPTGSEPIAVSLLRERHRSPPALPTSAKGLCLPLGGSQLELHCLLSEGQVYLEFLLLQLETLPPQPSCQAEG